MISKNKQSGKCSSSGSKVSKHHAHFGTALILFLGLSLYAMVSFFQATNLYVNQIQANVLDASVEKALLAEDVPVALSDNPFLDLDEDHLNRDAIVALYYRGIVNGGMDGYFRPDASVNRAEFSKMIVEATDIDLTVIEPLEGCFTDVAGLAEQWFAPYVCAAKSVNYVRGYEGGAFIADRNINRAESLKIVLTAFNLDITPNAAVVSAGFDDLAVTDWFLGVAESAVRHGLISTGFAFDAGHEMTRGEVAQIIYNAMVIQEVL